MDCPFKKPAVCRHAAEGADADGGGAGPQGGHQGEGDHGEEVQQLHQVIHHLGHVSPLLRFYSVCSYSIHVQPLNGHPSKCSPWPKLLTVTSMFSRKLVFPIWYSRSHTESEFDSFLYFASLQAFFHFLFHL